MDDEYLELLKEDEKHIEIDKFLDKEFKKKIKNEVRN